MDIDGDNHVVIVHHGDFFIFLPREKSVLSYKAVKYFFDFCSIYYCTGTGTVLYVRIRHTLQVERAVATGLDSRIRFVTHEPTTHT